MTRNTPVRTETGAGVRAPEGEAREGEARRIAELEAENAALRRALADAGSAAERTGRRHEGELAGERAGRAAERRRARSAALGAEARHGRKVAAGRADLAASEDANDALRRANAELAASRAALREREERLRLILASATDYAIFTTDLDRRVSSWNEGAERLLGWAEAEIVGRSADAIFTPEDRDAGAPGQEAEGALRDGRAADERWHVRKDGTRFWANGLTLPLRDPDADPAAAPVGLLKVMRDETGRRRAEDALRARERRLRLLADIAAGLLAAADPDGVLDPVFRELSEEFGVDVSFSHVAEGARGGLRLASCFGVPDEARAPFDRLAPGEGVCGRAARDRRPVRVADEGASDDPAVSALRAFGVRAYVAFPLAAGDGRLLGTLSFGSRTRARFSEEDLAFLGTIAHHVAVVRERLRAEAALRDGEARWRGLFQRMQEGFALCEMVYGPDGRAVDYRHLELNAAWGRLTGVPNERVQGKLVSEAIPGIEPFWLETYARVVETGEPAHFEHHLAVYGRWFEVMAYRTEPGRFAAVFLDVTERKRAEARRDALVELGDRLRDLRDPGEIARAAAEVIGRALGAARAGYATVDAAQRTARIERDWFRGPLGSVAGEHPLPEYWTGFADDLRRGEVVAVGDLARDPRTARHADSYTALGVRAFVHVPLVERGLVAALLFVHDTAPRDWSAEEVAFVRGAAERAWAAAARARAEEALRRFAYVVEQSSDFIGIADSEGRASFVNEAGRRMVGLEDLEAARRTRVIDYFAPEDRPFVEEVVLPTMRREGRWVGDFRFRHFGTGRPVPVRYNQFEIRDEQGRAIGVATVSPDITERKRAEERRALLIAELNHRVKNTLAVVQSLALQTARGAADLPAFSAAFQARLVALARAHDLLTRESWEGAALGDVVEAALEPGKEGRVDLLCACGGPGTPLLAPAQALALAMALHELNTNALKHGALSVPGGRVSVRCFADPEGGGARVVEWLERGGPPIAAPPARWGFGLRLLERGLAAQAGMSAELFFEPAGLRCSLRLPPAR